VEEPFFFGLVGFCVLDNSDSDLYDDLAECFWYSFEMMIEVSYIIDWELFDLLGELALFDDHLLTIHQHVRSDGT
jgi:hypothetical protein